MSEASDKIPLMRGQQVAANLKGLDFFRPDAKLAIAQHIPDQTLELIKSGKPWVRVEADIALCGAVHQVKGEEALIAYSQHCVVHSAAASVLTPLLQGAAKLLKLNPGSFITFGPTAWRSVYRSFGEFRYVDLGKHDAEAQLIELPDLAFEHDFYFSSIGGAFQGVIEAGGMQGKVRLVDVSPADRTVKFRIHWE